MVCCEKSSLAGFEEIMKNSISIALALLVGCAGADGEDGWQGQAGPRGPQGEQGPPGNSDVIVGELLCTGGVEGSFMTVYAWIMADGDAVGICDLDEFEGSDTEPLIAGSCSLVSRKLLLEGATSGLITIRFSEQGALLSGAFTGSLSCK
jgi:hypothetical protein